VPLYDVAGSGDASRAVDVSRFVASPLGDADRNDRSAELEICIGRDCEEDASSPPPDILLYRFSSLIIDAGSIQVGVVVGGHRISIYLVDHFKDR
jgi:hypothetical protein